MSQRGIKVEIQNLEAVGRAVSGLDDSRTEALATRERGLEEREERLASAEAEVADRFGRLEELEARVAPEAALVESRVSLDRRERPAAELERREELVGIREERLAERQRELGLYVSQIRGRIQPRLAAG